MGVSCWVGTEKEGGKWVSEAEATALAKERDRNMNGLVVERIAGSEVWACAGAVGSTEGDADQKRFLGGLNN